MYINTTFRKENESNTFVFKKDGLRLGQVRKRLLGQNGEPALSKEAEELR